MAKITGIFPFVGSLAGVQGRKTPFGNVIQTHGGFNGERVKTEARYEKTRQLSTEFGRCAKLSSLLKRTLDFYLKLLPDPYVYNHIQKWLTAVKECDADSPKGDKTVGKGMLTDSGKKLFNGFSFNRKRGFGLSVFENYRVDLEHGLLELKVDARRFAFPKDADAVGLQLVLLRIDLDAMECVVGVGEMVFVGKGDAVDTKVLEAVVPEGAGVLVGILFVGFGVVERGEVVLGRDVGNMLGVLGWL
ncbi:MAG TPA: hypothetical protein VK528_12090 [Flavobacterium sp.]|nr:hypothetical protein [Flavobacterium sp.]